MSLSSISGRNLGDPNKQACFFNLAGDSKMQGSNSLYYIFFIFVGFDPLIFSTISTPILPSFFSITNYPNNLASTWSWSCLNVSMRFTLRLFIYLQFNRVCSQANKISNSGIGPVPAMVEADTTRPSRTGIDWDFETYYPLLFGNNLIHILSILSRNLCHLMLFLQSVVLLQLTLIESRFLKTFKKSWKFQNGKRQWWKK